MNAGITAMDVQVASGAVLTWVSQALVFGTTLAVVTWLLSLLLRGRSSPRLEMMLWSIVLIKFLVPVGPGWSFSLSSTCGRIAQYATGGGIVGDGALTGSELGAVAQTQMQVSTEVASGAQLWHWTTIVCALYLLTIVGLLVARTRSYRVFRARCLALPAADDFTRKLVSDVCRRLGVRRMPLVRIDSESRAPFVMGLFRPVLVLSRRHLVRPDEVETVVVHEVTHLRRGDMLVRCLQCVAGTVLFFWPVVAWVNRWIDRAREHTCDEWALRHGRLTASEYARCLLGAGQPSPARRLAYQPACMAGSPSTIERRIDVILALPSRPRRRPAWGLLTIAILIAWGGFTLTGTSDATAGDRPTYLATQEGMDLHAQAVYARVNEHAAGDQDGDGSVSKEECWWFVTAVVMAQPEVMLAEYPQADLDEDGELRLVEAFLFVRGDYDIENLNKETQIAIATAKKAGDRKRAEELKAEAGVAGIEMWHVILDRRHQILDMMDDEPSFAKVKAISQKMAKIKMKKEVKGSLDRMLGEIEGLKNEAAKLRDKATQVGGEKAVKLKTKADHLEDKAAELKAQLIQELSGKIAKLEAAGHKEKAAELQIVLAELEAE